MSNTDYVVEVAIFTVKENSIKEMKAIRETIKEVLKGFDGFKEIEALNPVGDGRVFADIVKWDTLKNAKKASEAFMVEERLKPFMEVIEEVKFMGHFKP
jgi:heme-degrading monooxygenase HmoA